MSSVSHAIERLEVTFDDESLVANAGLMVPATLMARLGLEALVDATVRLVGLVGGSRPGRKICSLVATILAGGSHIDHADMLRAGATQRVLPFRVMAPSTLGTFLRSFTFGHVRQLDKVCAELLRRAWSAGAGPGDERLVIDVDSTICEVHGKAKQGATYGYTRVLGYHPLLATRADTGEVLHARMRKGRANTSRGATHFIEAVIARVRRAGAAGEIVVRVDSGFWSNDTHRHPRPARRALHDGRADRPRRHCCSDRRDRRAGMGRDRISRRGVSHTSRNVSTKVGVSSCGAPDSPTRNKPRCGLTGGITRS